ncbi:MAG: hypothetical protein M1826_006409 [Phylliscum demangeonii]|nr:MAG: hypothetical protein M1826_006409 [Phylliscum demangeonii]
MAMALAARLDGIQLPATADFHVHLRQGALMARVVRTIRPGGVDTVLVMPNLQPAITTVPQALQYQRALRALAPDVTFLMTLYLHRTLTTVGTLRAAKAAGCVLGLKAYPPGGVTTNSAQGVVLDDGGPEPDPVVAALLAEMERLDLVLNVHGECACATTATAVDGVDGAAIDVLNAEEAFLPTLLRLHARYPRLRIVLEHVTTAAAVAAVRAIPLTTASGDGHADGHAHARPLVAATITAHHLHLTVDDWAANPFHYCKPVAKRAADRAALLRACVSGDPRFFFGSDSAPHPVAAKAVRRPWKGGPASATGAGAGAGAAAGIFTQPYATQLVVDGLMRAVELGVLRPEQVTPDVLRRFLSAHGRAFYRLAPKEGGEEGEEKPMIELRRWGEVVIGQEEGWEEEEEEEDEDAEHRVLPFRYGEKTWQLAWLEG